MSVELSPEDSQSASLNADSIALELARFAVDTIAEPGSVGEYLGAEVEQSAENESLVAHSFVCLSAGYPGWRWVITLSQVGTEVPSVCDTVLMPGPDAVLAPAWVPWADRLAPGDLGAGDELPYQAEDPYLVPGFEATGDEDVDQVALWELGLGRERVLNLDGRIKAAQRWYDGAHGPRADVALAAQAACASCGYFVPVAGALRSMFGVCANEWSPSDGKVVSLDHGCGAHSQTDVKALEPEALPEPILDHRGADPIVISRIDPNDVTGDDSGEDEVSAEATQDTPIEATQDTPIGELDQQPTAEA